MALSDNLLAFYKPAKAVVVDLDVSVRCLLHCYDSFR